MMAASSAQDRYGNKFWWQFLSTLGVSLQKDSKHKTSISCKSNRVKKWRRRNEIARMSRRRNRCQ